MAARKSPPDIASRHLTALTGAELAILTAFISGGSKSLADLGIKGADALVTFLNNEGPMASRVLASWTENAHYVTALEFVNTTLHGGYLESLAVLKPATNFDFDIALPERKEGGISFPGDSTRDVPVGEFFWKKQADRLPLYVEPGGSA